MNKLTALNGCGIVPLIRFMRFAPTRLTAFWNLLRRNLLNCALDRAVFGVCRRKWEAVIAIRCRDLPYLPKNRNGTFGLIFVIGGHFYFDPLFPERTFAWLSIQFSNIMCKVQWSRRVMRFGRPSCGSITDFAAETGQRMQRSNFPKFASARRVHMSLECCFANRLRQEQLPRIYDNGKRAAFVGFRLTDPCLMRSRAGEHLNAKK